MTFVGPVHFYDFYSQLCNSSLTQNLLASSEIKLDYKGCLYILLQTNTHLALFIILQGRVAVE